MHALYILKDFMMPGFYDQVLSENFSVLPISSLRLLPDTCIAPNESLVQVYCDMEGANCGGQGCWTGVAYVNMSQSGATCPQGLTEQTFSGLTLCGRSSTGCQGTWVSILGLNYSRVCGQLLGYRWGTPEMLSIQKALIDSSYVDR